MKQKLYIFGSYSKLKKNLLLFILNKPVPKIQPSRKKKREQIWFWFEKHL